ncbi:GNAT family N-acetyltransferase [Alteromonas sp. ASW11-36]|uniref:GNAT family N-acetyltransferase n=1 Tax=Alteromonas arenosi TaxID=3055817 RepID=A0ABT7SZA9_9ALTE|nr:GNAT family N-acetyltransferase [Alteromonas sp. ASW11-36]MDM7861519.1 GNAT family N-acetyltransferase [Alteromonas sp. ASW11-36]
MSSINTFIARMAVKPEYQGKGYGSQLMTALEEVFPQAKRYELFTGENSAQNIAMYERRGCTNVGSKLLGKTRVVYFARSV